MAKPQSAGFSLFDTPIGPCGLAWTPRGIDRVELPWGDEAHFAPPLEHWFPDRPLIRVPPIPIQRIIGRLSGHLSGVLDPLDDIELDLHDVSPFAVCIYQTLRSIGPSTTVTYGALAERAGRPGAARAVGRALAANRLPLLVPCHRVVAANGRLGGFSAHGGLALKARLLAIEGVPTKQRFDP